MEPDSGDEQNSLPSISLFDAAATTSHRFLAYVSGALLLSLIIFGIWRSSPPDEYSAPCCQIELSEPLSWVTSSAWGGISDEQILFVVDAIQDEILSISTRGQVARLATPESIRRPTRIVQLHSGHLVWDADQAKVAHLDLNFQLQSSLRIGGRLLAQEDDWTARGRRLYSISGTESPGYPESRREIEPRPSQQPYKNHSRISIPPPQARATADGSTRSSDPETEASAMIERESSQGYLSKSRPNLGLRIRREATRVEPGDGASPVPISYSPSVPDAGKNQALGLLAEGLDDREADSDSSFIPPPSISANAELKTIYDWSPMGSGILALGDLELKGSRDDLLSAFFYFDERKRPQIFLPFNVTDSPNHYLRDMPSTAVLEDAGYILFHEEHMSIAEIRPDRVRKLPHFPEDFRSCPKFDSNPRWSETRRSTAHYRTLEESNTAAGIYTWNGNLYLLAKQAIRRDRETPWWLIRLDPQNGQELSRVRLPTGAAHLTVVPGDSWALIEKGPVEGIGDMYAPFMETSSIVFLKEGWIENPVGDPFDPSSQWRCPQQVQ